MSSAAGNKREVMKQGIWMDQERDDVLSCAMEARMQPSGKLHSIDGKFRAAVQAPIANYRQP